MMNTYSFKYGKTYNLDVTNMVTDEDEGIEEGTGIENIDNLTITWDSDIDGFIGRGPSIDVAAGKKTDRSQFDLKAGKTHNITVTVKDPDGASNSFTFTVKVADELVDPSFPTPQAYMFFTALLVGVIVVIVGVVLLYLKRPRKYY